MRKKQVFMIVVLVLLTCGLIFKLATLYKNYKEEKEIVENKNIIYTEELKYAIKNEDGTVTNKNTNFVAFDPNKNYNLEYVVDEVDLTSDYGLSVAEYTKYMPLIANKQSLNKFDDKTITTFVVFKMLKKWQDDMASRVPIAESKIKEFIKYYFDIENFIIKEGTYTLEQNPAESFTIVESNGYYIVIDCPDSELEYSANYTFNYILEKDNEVFVYYSATNGDEYSNEALGEYELKLTKKDNHLVFNNIKYNTFNNPVVFKYKYLSDYTDTFYELYETKDNRKVYSKLKEVYYHDNNKKLELFDQLKKNKIAINDFVSKLDYEDALRDGGSIVMKSNNITDQNFYLVNCNTIDGVKDIYIVPDKVMASEVCSNN